LHSGELCLLRDIHSGKQFADCDVCWWYLLIGVRCGRECDYRERREEKRN